MTPPERRGAAAPRTEADRVAEARTAVAAAARRLADAGLLVGTAGNVSVRLPAPGAGGLSAPDSGDLVAVTATGAVLGDCTAEQVTVVDLAGTVRHGDLAPTSELDLHLAPYDEEDVGAVVHTHAPYATAVACVLDELPVLHYQQMLLGGVLRVAPYATFGTPELADHVATALHGRRAALMANHGSVALGTDLADAVDNALLVEWLCRLHHTASALGTPRVLDEQQQHDVVAAALSRNYGTTRRNP